MNFDDIKVKADKSYPKIINAHDDPNTVAILKNLLCSRISEMNSTLQYLFDSVVADKSTEEIGGIFEEIAIVEMMHISMLMHAICDFGGVPRFEDRERNFFNTSAINYSTKLNDMLDCNLKQEKMAIEQYHMAVSRLKNDSLKALILRIVEDEELHIEALKKIRDNVEFFSI